MTNDNNTTRKQVLDKIDSLQNISQDEKNAIKEAIAIFGDANAKCQKDIADVMLNNSQLFSIILSSEAVISATTSALVFSTNHILKSLLDPRMSLEEGVAKDYLVHNLKDLYDTMQILKEKGFIK